jgi:hypothetical protein
VRAALPVIALLLSARTAAAQEEEELVDEKPPPPVYVAELRQPARAVLGLDFGIGMVDPVCAGCYAEGGLSLGVFAGVQATRRVAVLAEGWSLVHLIATDGDQTGVATLALATAAARVWVMPRLWIQAGAGGGWLLVAGSPGDADGVDFGPAAALAIGGEPGHRRCSGIDLSIRIGGATIPDDDGGDRVLIYNLAAMVGFHWN